jgi:hypothetical protein
MRLKLLSALAFLVALTAALAYTTLHLRASAAESSTASSPRIADYADDVFRFKVSYPADYAVREYAEDEAGARTIAFEGPSQGEGFQIFVVPYAHSAITPERFRIDDPSGVMKDAKETDVDRTPAKSFFGYNDQMGDTREVWFIHGGFLYEVTTYKPLDAWLTAILQSWKFI